MGAGLALLIYVPLFALRAMGGGDVKLMAAVGAIVGSWPASFRTTRAERLGLHPDTCFDDIVDEYITDNEGVTA